MSTEKQKLANQQNAQKSTGPKTAEGKEQSRRNALQHGMAGNGTVLTSKDAQRFRKEFQAWAELLDPINVLEETLVVRAALSKVKMERCLKKDLADVTRRRRRAVKRWDDRQDKALSQAIEGLPQNPADAIVELESLSLGCA